MKILARTVHKLHDFRGEDDFPANPFVKFFSAAERLHHHFTNRMTVLAMLITNAAYVAKVVTLSLLVMAHHTSTYCYVIIERKGDPCISSPTPWPLSGPRFRVFLLGEQDDESEYRVYQDDDCSHHLDCFDPVLLSPFLS